MNKHHLVSPKIILQHDYQSKIKILDQPMEMNHFSEFYSNRLQDLSMMDFQAKLTMVLRVKLKQLRVKLPLVHGKFELNIVIHSPRHLSELPLLDCMKGIMDAINKEIILDDDCIYKCTLDIHQTSIKSKSVKSRSQDLIDIKVSDMTTMNTVVDIKSINTFVVPKKHPLVLNQEEDIFFFMHKEMYHLFIIEELQKDSFKVKPSSKYSVKMNFVGDIASKDLDNIAKCYWPVLIEGNILLEQQITSLELNKRDLVTGKPFIEININCN